MGIFKKVSAFCRALAFLFFCDEHKEVLPMRLQKMYALTLAAAMSASMLTGCPWEQEEDAPSSSSSSSAARPSHDDDDDTPAESAPSAPSAEPGQPGYVAPDESYRIEEDGSYTVSMTEGLVAWADAMKEEGNYAIDCTLTVGTEIDGSRLTTIGGEYTGSFNGNDSTISGLSVPLFSSIGSKGTVENLKLEAVNINDNGYAGGIARTNYGTIQNCTVNGDVTSNGTSAGGVAGENDGTIQNCTVSGDVTSNDDSAGGIAGANVNGTIQNCTVSGNVTSNSKVAGGIVGSNQNGRIIGCMASGDVTGGDTTGGIAGQTDGNDTVKACCYVGGTVTSTGKAAYGIMPSSYTSKAVSCYWSGSISGKLPAFTVDGVTEVTTWTDAAIKTMNRAMGDGCAYQFALDATGTPKLVPNHTTAQAVERLIAALRGEGL